MALPFVALVGRPNVGKSTLFNRIVGERVSVVDDRAGTTRDRIYARAEWTGRDWMMVDTGGIEPLEKLRDANVPVLAEASKDFVYEIRSQAEAAIADADVIIFTVDGQAGLTSADEAVATILRKLIGQRQRAGKKIPPIIVAVSKSESQNVQRDSVEFYKLGLGDVFAVSGLQGTGVGDLLDAVVKELPPVEPAGEEEETLKIALLGRPNVGKSSMFNALIGEPRVIVSNVPGTTRDTVDTRIDFTEQIESIDENGEPTMVEHTLPITLIDTAGIRKRGTIEPGVEKFSVLRSFKAIERADVVLLLIDPIEGITAQDEHIAGYIVDANKGIIVLANKWDLVESAEKVERIAKPVEGWGNLTEKMERMIEIAQRQFNFIKFAPVLFVSAATGFRVNEILPAAVRVNDSRQMRVQTSDLNRIIRDANIKHAPPVRNGRPLKVFFGTQVAINPPTFVIHVNDAKLVHFTYRRYLENCIRSEFNFFGTPIRVVFKGRDDRD